MSQVQQTFMRAQALLYENKAAEALSLMQPLAARYPADPSINSLMAMTFLRLARPQHALPHAERAVEATKGADPIHLTNLAIALLAAGQRSEGIQLLTRTIDAAPSYHEARQVLANLLLDDRQFSKARDLCRAGLDIAWHPKLASRYAAALIALCDNEQAVSFLKEATARCPDDLELAGQLAVSYQPLDGADPDEVAVAHRAYGALADRLKPPFRAPYAPDKDPLRRIRVALVSPDLHQHSVAYFIEPFLEHFDREQFDVICYSTNQAFDGVSRRLRDHASAWRDAFNMIEPQLAAKMSEDRIDIAIDLSGHTNGNYLLAFAMRMAPIQVTCIGYPDTTGLAQMDYRIVDSLTDPPSAAHDARCTETLVRMDPCFLCYRPPPEASQVPHPTSPRDAAATQITFGSFNALRKLNRPTIDLWARLLGAVPHSQLLLKALDFGDPEISARIHQHLKSHGIDPSRLKIIEPPKSVAEHLAAYAQVDIALDPFPYNGTTTTCEALWMGVPVVTLAGSRHGGRVGTSLLTNAGLPELVAQDDGDYIRIASSLARSPDRLAGYHTTLRARMAQSPLCDGPAFAKRLGSTLRTMWRSYCTGARA